MSEGGSVMVQRRTRQFTQAEEDVICLLMSGEVACGKEIAHRLHRPVTTVYEQLHRARCRIGVRSNAQLVAVLARQAELAAG